MIQHCKYIFDGSFLYVSKKKNAHGSHVSCQKWRFSILPSFNRDWRKDAALLEYVPDKSYDRL